MTALAEVGVDFRCWKDFISDRSKTVKDLLDLSKERYPNARGFSVFVASKVSVWKTDGIRLRTGSVLGEILDQLVEGAVSQVMYPGYK